MAKRNWNSKSAVGLFERVVIGKQSLPPSKNQLYQDIANSFKDTYIFEFLNLPEEHNKDDLQRALLTLLKTFIL